MEKKKIHEIILTSVNEILSERNINIDNISEATELLGPGSILDSIGLVTLIANVESKIYEKYKILITLVNEKAFSQQESPFKTIRALSRYTYNSIQGNL